VQNSKTLLGEKFPEAQAQELLQMIEAGECIVCYDDLSELRHIHHTGDYDRKADVLKRHISEAIVRTPPKAPSSGQATVSPASKYDNIDPNQLGEDDSDAIGDQDEGDRQSDRHDSGRGDDREDSPTPGRIETGGLVDLTRYCVYSNLTFHQ
jgi:hypothetical protein